MGYRDETKVVQIGKRQIGGGNPILIQSMCNTKTEDVEATVDQILKLEAAGCDIIRVAVPTMEAADAIRRIKREIHIPLVADIHFDYRLAIAAMESGADFCIPSRLIPGGDDGGLNWYRKFVSGTARKIGQWMLPCLRKISDPTSGLFMFRREVIEGADLQPIGWKIMVEVLAMGSYKKVVEIPYKFQQRTEGESKLSGKVTMEYLKQLKDLRKRYNKANKYEVEIWSTEKMMAE